MIFAKVFVLSFALWFAIIWLAISAVTAASTKSPITNCLTSIYMDCR